MYFLKKIHKNPPSARPIVSGCSGPTERISAYLDHWLQPLAKSLLSYIKDTKEFIKYILHKNVFRFNDKFYIQKQGTAMGTKMAPAYASIFMGTLESRILSETNPSPIHWKRYIDDIFLVWTDTKESLEQFIKSINAYTHASISPLNFQWVKSHF